MSITYYSLQRIFFAASTREIRALERLIDLTRPHLDHADHFNVLRDRISLHASNEVFTCNWEWVIELVRDESGWSNYD